MTSPHPGIEFYVAQEEFIQIAPAVCERFLGDLRSRSAREWRGRGKGSFRLKLDTGGWSDYESGEGGGVLALVMREEHCDKAGAVEWLQQQGFLHKRSAHAPSGNYQRVVGPGDAPRSAENRDARLDRDPKKTLRWIRRQILSIGDAPDHPVRPWMRQRNLWRPDIPLIYPCHRLYAGYRQTRPCLERHTQGLAPLRFHSRQSLPAESAIPQHHHRPRCNSYALTAAAGGRTTRTGRGIS